jgi:hypothetical protein
LVTSGRVCRAILASKAKLSFELDDCQTRHLAGVS